MGKKLILLVLVSAILTGCNAKKHSVKEEIHIDKENVNCKTYGLETLNSQRGFIQTIMDSLKMDYRYSFKIYDTDKPVDSETHLPPLLAEFDIGINLENVTNTETKDSSNVEISDEKIVDFHKESSDSIFQKEEIDKSVKTKVGRNMIASSILVIVLLASFIIVRRRRS